MLTKEDRKFKIHMMILTWLVIVLSSCNRSSGMPPMDVIALTHTSQKQTPLIAEQNSKRSFYFPYAPNVMQTQTHSPTEVPGIGGGESQEQSEINDLEFSPDSANTIPPEDVLEEIEYVIGAQGGGGGGLPTCPTPMFSSGDQREIYKFESMETAYFFTCGWQPEEDITVTVFWPDSNVTTYDETAETKENCDFSEFRSGCFMSTNFPTTLENPEGWYHFSFSGRSSTIHASVYFKRPPKANIYLLGKNELLFYQFLPFETVRLFAFQKDPQGILSKREIIAWQDFEMDENGELLINTEFDTDAYIAIGEMTGEVRLREKTKLDTFYDNFSNIIPSKCLNAPESRVSKGMEVRIPFGKNYLSLYDSPDFLYGSISRDIEAGDILSIIDGPICIQDRNLWWLVETNDGYRGWISEGNRNSYNIEPLPKTLPGCENAPITRIRPDIIARVTYTDGRPLNIRSSPGLSGPIKKSIPEGTPMYVMEGPNCVDGYYWWKIQAEDNTTGWVAEGERGNYYVEFYKP